MGWGSFDARYLIVFFPRYHDSSQNHCAIIRNYHKDPDNCNVQYAALKSFGYMNWSKYAGRKIKALRLKRLHSLKDVEIIVRTALEQNVRGKLTHNHAQ